MLIDSLKKCSEAMGALIDRAEPVAVDFEGIALSREGRLCLAQVVSADDSEPVYLVDVVALGADAFGVGRLGELLSSETLVKLVFDCRSDREALRHQFGVALNQVYDIQVVYCMRCDEVAGHRVGRLRGLRAALGDCPGLDSEARRKLEETKDAGRRCSSRRTANRATLGRETVTARARELRRRGRPVPSRHVQGVEAFHEAGQDGQGRGQAQTEKGKRARLLDM